MKLTRSASSGSMLSGDCLITVSPAEELELVIKSPLLKPFGHLIQQCLEQVLEEFDIRQAHVLVEDFGALDYTIKARMISAIGRANE